jgi:hypothetical protein
VEVQWITKRKINYIPTEYVIVKSRNTMNRTVTKNGRKNGSSTKSQKSRADLSEGTRSISLKRQHFVHALHVAPEKSRCLTRKKIETDCYVCMCICQ